MKKHDFTQRFGFLVNEVGRLYGRQFDQLAREQLGLSRAQCRLLGVLASSRRELPWTQVELAHELDLTPMAVATLVDRMESSGWITRRPVPGDRRANAIEPQPQAAEALDRAIALSNIVQERALDGLTPAERRQLLELLRRTLANLQGPAPEAVA